MFLFCSSIVMPSAFRWTRTKGSIAGGDWTGRTGFQGICMNQEQKYGTKFAKSMPISSPDQPRLASLVDAPENYKEDVECTPWFQVRVPLRARRP
jgi:hypothetical protein